MQRLLADLECREAQLRAQEEELKQRDTDISRLMSELRQCQIQLQTEQVNQIWPQSIYLPYTWTFSLNGAFQCSILKILLWACRGEVVVGTSERGKAACTVHLALAALGSACNVMLTLSRRKEIQKRKKFNHRS